MKKTLLLIGIIGLVSCGKDGKNGKNGLDTSSFGINNGSIGVELEDISPGLACASGGISIFTFRDFDSDGVHSSEESIIKVKSICNGVNGSNGSNGSLTLESVVLSEACPQGGVKISSSTSSTPLEVCNGANGLNGEQGIQGIQGIPGMAGSTGADGADGTVITPVKFCATDNSTFPEYGLMIGDDLFAVYFGTTPASPNKSQAFLTKLIPGNYMSTGGNNCLFSVE